MGQETEVLSLIDIIKSIREYFAEFIGKWRLVALIVFSTSAIGLIYSHFTKPNYVATSTMMLENSKNSSSMAGALALASQFGLIGSSSSSVINEEKLVEIIKAETIVYAALFKKATINSKTDILANHFIDLFGYEKSFEKIDSLKGFRFVNQRGKLTPLENRVLKMFYSRITKKVLFIDKSKSGIITITTKSSSEFFSKYFNQYLVEAVTSFYVNRITEKGRSSLEAVQKRVDSVAIELKNAEYALARWKDANFHLVKAQGLIAEMDLRRNVEVNNSIYIEGIKQLEISKFTLLQDTPFLQIIDEPMLPLEPIEVVSPLRGTAYGFFIGFFLSALVVFVRKKYADLIAEDQLSH